MPSPDPTFAPSTTKAAPLLPSTWLLSLATIPMLIGLVGVKALSAIAQELGEKSEEIFRGDRLPVLEPLMTPSTTTTDEASVASTAQ